MKNLTNLTDEELKSLRNSLWRPETQDGDEMFDVLQEGARRHDAREAAAIDAATAGKTTDELLAELDED